MDRLNQLRADAGGSGGSGGSGDSTIDTSSLPSEAYMSANEGSSKYFSLSEVDSSFSISPTKEAASNSTVDSPASDAESLISNLSPIPKKSDLDSFKIGEQIEAANILSGGVNIFEDNENSYDEDELVIDDAAQDGDDKASESKLIENSELRFEKAERDVDTNMDEAVTPTKDTEVVLQIDGNNVDAIDIGNGLYLYRKDGEEELAAVQILEDDQQQPNIKFLKVRENAEGNLEVYEEIEIEVPKEVPSKEGKPIKNTTHVPVKDLNKISEPICNKVNEKKSQTQLKDTAASEVDSDFNKDNTQIESKTEVNLNGKMMKFSESRKSPLIGTFTPMTYHSTPNKERIPLTKTMVDQQLHPNRHSENVKKTIEVHTDNSKQRLFETPTKSLKDTSENIKCAEISSPKQHHQHKEQSNAMPADKPGQICQETSENTDNVRIGNKTDEKITEKINDDKINVDLKFKDQNKSFTKEMLEGNLIKDDRTEICDFKTPSHLESELKALAVVSSECILNMQDKTEEHSKGKDLKEENIPNLDLLGDKVCINDISPKIIEKSAVAKAETENRGQQKAETTLNDNFTKPNNIEVHKDNVQPNNNSETVITKYSKLDDVNVFSGVESHTNKIQNQIETSGEIGIKSISTESNKPRKLSESSPKKAVRTVVSTVVHCKKSSVGALENLPECDLGKSNHDIKLHKPVEILDNLLKDTETKVSAAQPIDTLKESITDVAIKTNTNSEVSKEAARILDVVSLKETNIGIEIKQLEDKPKEDLPKLPKIYEKNIKNISLIPPPELKQQEKVNTLKEVEIKKDVEFKQQQKDSILFDQLPKDIKTKARMDINISKTKFSNQCENVTKKTNVEIKLPEKSYAFKSDKDGIKLVSNTDYKTNILKPSIKETKTAEVAEVQKVFEPKNNLMVCEKSKHSLHNPESKSLASQNLQKDSDRTNYDTNKEPTKIGKSVTKPINNNKAAVPFGMWTEANRQEFLNKIKEAKVPTHTSNTKQLKQPNDLNRRDVLQKIDSQRQSNNASAKVQELNTMNKNKSETGAFVSKSSTTQKEKYKSNKDSNSNIKEKEIITKPQIDDKTVHLKKVDKDKLILVTPVDMSNTALNTKKDQVHRKEINNQDLIDKTIEGIINRAVTAKFNQDDVKQNTETLDKSKLGTSYIPVTFDEIESKMNELHGIPFVERPPHELPKVFDHENKASATSDVSIASTATKIPNLIPFVKKVEQNVIQPIITRVNEANESDEEIIEHEPITGDSELNKNKEFAYVPAKDNLNPKNKGQSQESVIHSDFKKESIITEKDFDKFARRNSITYENCLTVNFDGKEQHNVIHTVVEKETSKKMSRNEIMLAQSKAKSNKHIAMRHNNLSSKIPSLVKATNEEDSYNKNYQSKVQIAYQSVMTAKRQQECPITIIEDKPVKVVFMDANPEFTPHQLNVQGKDLSPSKKSTADWDHFTHSNSESLDSDVLDGGIDNKSQDDTKFKSKHQRKQVLTPVEAPELELIEPCDLGIEVSPKKKRKIEDNKSERNCKTLVPKKSYLLNRNITMEDTPSKPQDLAKSQQDMFIKHSDAISAIDNLVKAAELLETQSENKHATTPPNDHACVDQENTPAKRGRGRPRKYPLPESESDSKSPSPVKTPTPTPQKKPRLIDAKIPKPETESEDDDMSSDGEFVKENWTMGKINENIVCPICNKLFRSENVVFKHVKHCTGPSPSRSDSDKRSPRRMRQSQELDWKSEGSKSDSMDIDDNYEINKPTKKRKSKEKRPSSSIDDKTDIIIIDDTPVKDAVEKREKLKLDPNKTIGKVKVQQKTSSLVCEFCGKTFRQLSYLVNHKLQHKSTEGVEKEQVHKSLFSCEICKKDFRKLHHLVQHRIIHNPNTMSSRTSRKSSSEQSDTKTAKTSFKSSEDQSAGFRCEPCDKSFRKLHHLVEHRETHDEMNKKCNIATTTTMETTKANILHNCEICKKTFKKLQHLIEHKEHHLDTSSEKSDDKSVKSSLSTKDIIHECPLCYMVFPNEHSLNKHTIICQRKKKQSAAKQSKQTNENDTTEVDDSKIIEADEEKICVEENTDSDTCEIIEDIIPSVPERQKTPIKEIEKPIEIDEIDIHKDMKPVEETLLLVKTQMPVKEKSIRTKYEEEHKTDKVPVKSKKPAISTSAPIEIIKIPDTPTPKKKQPPKNKIGATVTKRKKTSNVPTSGKDVKKTEESSDDDEIRYMINPNLMDESKEGKLFMKIRAMKRNSLQIERPNSKDLMKRRISLQHPPKIPRLKVNPVPKKPINTNTVVKSTKANKVQPDTRTSIDSDDNEVKYSFPVMITKEVKKEVRDVEKKVRDVDKKMTDVDKKDRDMDKKVRDVDKKVKKQSVVEKRKSLSGIAKRKSLGKVIAKHKVIPSPAKQIKKRSTHAELRCDCGQLFSSAALLARHASLAHTPPRVRRRRSPPPAPAPAPNPNSGVATRKSSVASDAKTTGARKPAKQEVSARIGVATRKSSVSADSKSESRRSTKPEPVAASAKISVATRKSSDMKTASDARRTRRSGPQKEVPVPMKMRKLMDKPKK